MQLNYESLKLPVTEADIKKYAAHETSWISRRTIAIVSVILGSILTVPAIIGLAGSGRLFTVNGVLQVGMMLGIAAFVVIATILITKYSARQNAKMRRFAEANGAVLTTGANPVGLSGLIFDNGHTQRVENAYTFPDGVEIGNYNYTVGSGKSERTYYFSYAKVALGRNLPNMVLDAKSNNFIRTNLPDSFHASQKMTLEGDFNDHFDLYVPENYQRDALYIFTPDVMTALIDHGKGFDMEVVGSDLYLYKSESISLTSEVELRRWMTIIDSISVELRDQSKRYVDERALNQPANSTMPLVAEQGRRLKHGVNYFAIALGVAFLIVVFLPPFLPRDIGDTVSIIGWLILIALAIARGIAYAAVRLMRR